jgi:hypothetical protein
MVELSLLSQEQARAVLQAARQAHVRVMAKTLSGVVGIVDWGADENALRDPKQVEARYASRGGAEENAQLTAARLSWLGRKRLGTWGLGRGKGLHPVCARKSPAIVPGRRRRHPPPV